MSTPALPINNKATASSKSKSVQQQRKKRVVRRRGRGPAGMGSDDEIEREVASDSESDNDDHSSLDSATDDSDTEPASEDSPSRLESPPAPAVVGDVNAASAPFFATSSTWSDMVADEATHGAVGLPVVDFAEFDGQVKVPARRAKKQKQKKQQPQQQQQRQPNVAAAAASAVHPPEPIAEEQDLQSPVDATSPTHNTAMRSDSIQPRKLGQTARQAYQQRLEADPSYVPKVGGFWGHDDRLMDKDLRSLSGWWRGKWSGRGRGRGFGGMRGGAHAGYEGHEFQSGDLPPVERQWTHDGFEEMKRKEDHRRQDGPPARGRGGHRGGRGRGRGGGFGSSWHSPAQREAEVPLSRQSEAALFDEVKGKGGKAAIRVKLPGKGGQIAHSKGPLNAKNPTPAPETAVASSTTQQPQYTVKLPKGKAKAPAETSKQSASAPVESVSSEVQAPAPPVAVPTAFPNSSIISQLGQLSLAVTPSNPERQAQTEEAVLRKAGSVSSADGRPEAETTATSEQRPALPPLQTVFTPPPPPVAHQSPTFGSPYNFPQALPPGIALNQHGMPYEVATGRPVYLQPPPPQPMYNPQPMHYPPPGMYMHGPMHHPIASPDFHAQQQPPSHTPPVNGFVDPATGQPIFALPRSVRIEIRAPGDTRNPSSPPQVNIKPPGSNSKLRTGATSFEPSREFNHVNRTPSEGSSHPPSYETTNGAGGYENGHQQHPPPPHMMHYPGYQHQGYYYPEAYGYPAYMDMGQGHGQYETYNPEQGQQGTVYY